MDNQEIRNDFPMLIKHPHFIYFDNAATTQKPQSVIDALTNYYENDNFNVHRSVYSAAERTTQMFEACREKVAQFINAKDNKSIIFTAGTTQGINQVANGYYKYHLKKDDEIVVSIAEHHSNLLPWQNLAKQNGAKLKFIDINNNGTLNLNSAKKVITDNTKLVSITAVSNVLGTINNLAALIEIAHQHNADVLIDAAQAAPEIKIDVQKLNPEWLAFSGHKMLAPTGIGILYGKKELLAKMNPTQLGGEMIEHVDKNDFKAKDIPYRLEAGTPNVEGVIGLSKAIDYLENIGMNNIENICKNLGQYLYDQLSKTDGISVYGPKQRQTGIVSFNIDKIHPHDAATYLDFNHIAVRAGQHCAEPLTNKLGVNATLRASMYFYNNKHECDKLVQKIIEMRSFFNGA
ncbi:cysteine desulfurase [Apilactobacillus micheneri]|uniref:cysteine desulfurase n=1 Tax=Apilactobacillus micheneri TaxID=1899430 RepID=A0ABY2YZA4_9LACO|nr:cysteine desulfurase [Apilactobacillus micheneri]TPR26445.1 cysteine desulfurase [Apilactobacillus micheneri]TPR27199.1 cysteine desulfurase [Apilactobacillus micheneri]TPR27446.1 cysteine desulfurase [Apilactobacillus micheneri]TPR31962.1 cysteine desulfurase [Apilactobacillus micheneri]TPR32366.1 cysteine desulfurase [Apilactobacillus micheneri]